MKLINTTAQELQVNKVAKLVVYFMSTLLLACATPASKNTSLLEDGATPPSIEEIMAEGDKQLQANDVDAAQISYALAVERDSKNITAIYKLAYVHTRKNSLDVAESLLRHGISIDDSHVASKQLLGLVFIREKKIGEAEAVFNQVLAINPNESGALNGLGVIHDMRAEHAKAQQYFARALSVNPRSAKISNNLGYSLYLSDNYEDAERYFRDALNYDSNYKRAWSNIALLFSRTGRVREAETAFRKIGSEHQAANNLGYLGIIRGDWDLAREQLNRAVNIAPSYYELASRNLDTLQDPTPSILTSSRKLKTTSLNNDSSATNAALSSTANRNLKEQADNKESVVLYSVQVREPIEFASTSSRPTSETSNLATEDVQKYLNFLGYDAGVVDGQAGNATLGAIKDFQRSNSLEMDGKVGFQTSGILIKAISKAVNNYLLTLGYIIASGESELDTLNKTALMEFQKNYGLNMTGQLSSQTLGRLSDEIARIRDTFNSSDSLDLTSRG